MVSKPTVAAAMMAFLILICGASAAHATPIIGDFSIANAGYSAVIPIRYSGGVYSAAGANFGNAKALDFTNIIIGGVPKATPGVMGDFRVNSADNDFIPLLGSIGKIKDFAFGGPGSAAYPLTPILAWEVDGIVLSVRLDSVVVAFQAGRSIVLEGDVTFFMPGKDPTAGTFTLSANQSGRTFSFSAAQGASASAVPEPATLSLLTLGLVGMGLLIAKRK